MLVYWIELLIATACLLLLLWAAWKAVRGGIARRRLERAEAQKRRHEPQFDLIAHLERQWEFSLKTFGPGYRHQASLAHIRKELDEIEKNPHDLYEWVDVLLLAFDGARRAGYSPQEICQALSHKLSINEQRTWPDWRTVPEGTVIEHSRSELEKGKVA